MLISGFLCHFQFSIEHSFVFDKSLMNLLWITEFFVAMLAMDVRLFAASAPMRVLNINWKCADGAPCLNIVRPRGGAAVVRANADSFKLEISVHRQEEEKEEILQNWVASPFNSWDVEVTWFRLVERRVRIPMHKCKNKVVCMATLVDDDAITNSDDNYGKANMLSHHFQVSVNYKGHKPASSAEIVLEREVSGLGPEVENGVQYDEESYAAESQRIDDAESALYSHEAADADATIVAGNKKRSKGVLTKIFTRLGPALTIFILLAIAILMSVCCVCCVNRCSSRPGDMFRYQKLNSDSDSKHRTVKSKGRGEPKGARGVFNSLSSLLKHRSKRNYTPRMSTRAEPETPAAEGTRLLDGEEEGANDLEEEDDDDDSGGGKGAAAEMYRAIRKTGSKVFRNIRDAARKSGTFIKGTVNHDRIFSDGSNSVSALLPETVSEVLWPYSYVWKSFRKSPTYRRIRREVNAKIFEFVPSRDDDANDEINLLNGRQSKKEDMPPATVPKVGTSKQRETSPRPPVPRAVPSKQRKESARLPVAKAGPSKQRKESARLPAAKAGLSKQRKELPRLPASQASPSKQQKDSPGLSAPRVGPSKQRRDSSHPSVFETDLSKRRKNLPHSPVPKAVPTIQRDSKAGALFTPTTDISGRFYPSGAAKAGRDSRRKSKHRVMFPSARTSDWEERQIRPMDVAPASRHSPPPLQDYHCSCHQNAGDTGASTSSLCRNESVHSPRKHRCSLHCLQKQSSPRPPAPGRSLRPRPPGHAPIPPRIPRAISSGVEAPPLFATSETADPSDRSRVANSANSPSDIVNELNVGRNTAIEKPEFQHGDASSCNMTVLERTKYFFRRENEHMEALLQSWEERTNGRTHANGRGGNRSRAWLAHRRNRRRELLLQQEARQLENPAANSTEASSSVGHVTSDRANQKTNEAQNVMPRDSPLLPHASRSNMPRTENTLQQRDLFSPRPQTTTPEPNNPAGVSASASRDAIPVKIFSWSRNSASTKPAVESERSPRSLESDDTPGPSSTCDSSIAEGNIPSVCDVTHTAKKAEEGAPRSSISDVTLGTSSTCDSSSVEDKKPYASDVTQAKKNTLNAAVGAPRSSTSDDTLGTSSTCDSVSVEDKKPSVSDVTQANKNTFGTATTALRSSKSDDTLGTSSTCDSMSDEDRKLFASDVTQANKTTSNAVKEAPRSSKSEDTLGTSSSCSSSYVDESKTYTKPRSAAAAAVVRGSVVHHQSAVNKKSRSSSPQRVPTRPHFPHNNVVTGPIAVNKKPIVSSQRGHNESPFLHYSVVNKEQKSRHAVVNCAARSPRGENTHTGRNYHDSANDCGNLPENELRTSKTDNFSPSLIGTSPPVPPKLFDVREYMSDYGVISEDWSVQTPCAQRALNSAALAFLCDEEYESFSSEEGEDEFWRVNF